MSRHLHRERIGLPTPRQRALVLLVLTNARGKPLHPITELHAALGGLVPLHTMWHILSNLLSEGLVRVVGPNDPSARYALTSWGFAIREIEAEMTRTYAPHETELRGDAKRLGLKLPYRDVYRPPPDGASDGHSGVGGNGTGEGQP